MLIDLLGTLMLVAALAVIGIALLFVYWVFGGGAWAWSRERKERKEQERFEEEDADRAQDWDMERAQELAEWVRQGVLPSPITRLYPAYQEFTGEWARLQSHGYQLDHDRGPAGRRRADGHLQPPTPSADRRPRLTIQPRNSPVRSCRSRVGGSGAEAYVNANRGVIVSGQRIDI